MLHMAHILFKLSTGCVLRKRSVFHNKPSQLGWQRHPSLQKRMDKGYRIKNLYPSAHLQKYSMFQDNPDPEWGPVKISSGKLCNGDWNRAIKFEVFDHDMNGGHDYIGEYNTTLDEVTQPGHKRMSQPRYLVTKVRDSLRRCISGPKIRYERH